MGKSKKKFKTEVQQLLDLVIHSLYSHREIFLRELISNASDAIDRARFEALSDKSVSEPEGGWKIKLIPDTEAKTLVIQDNGVGMNSEELEANIGTIANSGTRAFLEGLKEGGQAGEVDLIGQFGVGFYSAFMVADKVTVVTRRHNEGAEALRWESTGDGSYTVETCEKETPGTEITLHMKDDQVEYLEEWNLRQTVKKFSDYVAFPIVMDISREEVERDEEGNEVEGGASTTVIEEQTLNSMEAIWLRDKKKLKPEDYNEFYKSLTHDWTDPAKVMHWRAEAPIEFSALLYLPGKAPMDVFQEQEVKGLHLYVKRVFIMNDCKDLLPTYLRFVKGVVDASDLSLNVSREMLQDDPVIRKIRKNLVSKVLSTLKQMKNKKPDEYLLFWNELGKVLKEGMHGDNENKEKLQDLLLFQSSKSEDLLSLKDYVDRMKPDQKEIYYLTGETRSAVLNSPHLEAFKKKDLEVLLLTDPIDEWVVMSLPAYDEKKLVPVDRGDIDIHSEEEKEEIAKHKEESEKEHADLLTAIQRHLDEEVKEVRLSGRLTDSACVLVADQFGMNANMERIMQAMGQEAPKEKRILELNPDHPILDAMQKLFEANAEDPRLKDYSEMLYDQGLITEGNAPRNPLTFAQRISDLMVSGAN